MLPEDLHCILQVAANARWYVTYVLGCSELKAREILYCQLL